MAGVDNCQYQHGPIYWEDQSWPLVGIQNSDLNLRAFHRARAIKKETWTGA